MRNGCVLCWSRSSGDGEAWADLGVVFGGTDMVPWGLDLGAGGKKGEFRMIARFLLEHRVGPGVVHPDGWTRERAASVRTSRDSFSRAVRLRGVLDIEGQCGVVGSRGRA